MYDCDYNCDCDVTPPFIWIGIMPLGGAIGPGDLIIPEDPIDP